MNTHLTDLLAPYSLTVETFIDFIEDTHPTLLDYINKIKDTEKRITKKNISEINEALETYKELEEEEIEVSTLNEAFELETEEEEEEEEVEEDKEEILYNTILETMEKEKKKNFQFEEVFIDELEIEISEIQNKLNEKKTLLIEKNIEYSKNTSIEDSEIKNYIYEKIKEGKIEYIDILKYMDNKSVYIPPKKSYNTKKTNSTNNKETNYYPNEKPPNFFFKIRGEETSADEFFKRRFRCAFNCRIERNSREGMKSHILNLCEKNAHCPKVLKKYENNYSMNEVEVEKYLDGEEKRLKENASNFKADFKKEKVALDFS